MASTCFNTIAKHAIFFLRKKPKNKLKLKNSYEMPHIENCTRNFSAILLLSVQEKQAEEQQLENT